MTRKEFTAKYGKILLPLVTPYDENEEIRYDVYADLINYLIKNDLCDSLIVTGTTGEASLLTFDERVKLMKVAVETAAGRKPVIAGTGCASTKETIALTKEAEKLGIDLCMVVCPFYNKPTMDGVYTQVTDYFLATEKTDPEFVVFNGDDVMLLPTIVQGAMGIVSGGAHIFGHEIRAIFEAFEKGDNEKARELFVPLYRFCKSCGQNGRILPNSIMRPAIELVTGIPVGPARSPLAPITDEEMAVLKQVLKEVGKL